MYTMCWTDPNGNDKWDRFDTLPQLAKAIITNHLEEDEDLLIFGPDAEDYRLSTKELVSKTDLFVPS